MNFGFDEAGNWRLNARLAGPDGALAQKALEAARDEIFNERSNAGDTPEHVEPQVTWAEAFVRMCEHALADMTTGNGSRSRDHHQLLLYVRGEDLDTNPDPMAWLHLGPAISRNLARYLSCDCDVRLVVEDDGRVVSVGRKHRTAPDHTRKAVEDSDRGCRYPGCTNTRWLDCHHIIHWQDGGATDTCNLCCLCRLHHRLHHLGYFTITGNADQPHGFVFTDRYGKEIPTGPRPVPPPRRPTPTTRPLDPPHRRTPRPRLHLLPKNRLKAGSPAVRWAGRTSR